MTVFKGWENYTEKIYKNWNKIVTDNDTVVVPGDISWAMKLHKSFEDLKFIHELPGRKILLKGNHDLWWETISKLENFINEHGFDTISFLHNNAFVVDDYAICGSRGWFFDDDSGNDKKVLLREAMRVDRSIELGRQTGKIPLVFLHYPPITMEAVCHEIMDVLIKHEIKNCYYGHIHGARYARCYNDVYEGIRFKPVSCDILNFIPMKIMI